MSASAGYKAFLLEQMAMFGAVTIKSMFGGAGVYHDGLMFALIDDDQLYIKADPQSKAQFIAEGSGPFVYMGKDRKPMEMAYFRAPERCFDDPDEMRIWCALGFAAAQRAAAKKPARKAR
jgi:DNA transformation protein and related proteins